MNNKNQPPNWLQVFFRWYCPSILQEEIEGDLFELYQQRQIVKGSLNANFHYLVDIIRFCNPTTFQKARGLSPNKHSTSYLSDMINHYLLLMWRNIRKQPIFSLLNLIGLTVGIAATMLIMLYVNFEINYDRHHLLGDRIYRVNTTTINTHSKDLDVNWSNTPGNLGPFITKDYQEVEQFVRFYDLYQGEGIKMLVHNKELIAEDVYAVDPSVFDVFTVDFISGDPSSALVEPNSIVISQQLAKQLFGSEDPLGKTIETNQRHQTLGVDLALSLKITGVFRDWPENVHLPVKGMISSSSDPELANYYFNRFGFITYVLLRPEAIPDVVAAKLSDIYLNYLDATRDPVLKSAVHQLMPLSQIHMDSSGGLIYVYVFSAVAFLLMLIAIISYVNMVTAQASKRLLEMGLRKVLGSHRFQLCTQIFVESLFFALLAYVVAIGLVSVVGPKLNDSLNLHLDLTQLWQPKLLLLSLAMVLLIGFMGGSYPAFFLSGFKPVSILKGNVLKGASLRKWLVTIQFAVVVFVLVSTGMIYEQLKYAKEKDLGFNQEQILSLTLTTEEQHQKWPVFKEALTQSPYIKSVASSTFIPGRYGLVRAPFSTYGSSGPDPQFVRFGEIDYDFIATVGIEIVEGRNFSQEFNTDLENAIIVNEAFVQRFGISSPLGAKVRRGDIGNPNYLVIVGVINDFHHGSLHEPIEPQLFYLGSASQVVINVKNNLGKAIQDIEGSWAKMFPDNPFEIEFLSDAIQQGYEVDRIRGKIFFLFSVITIVIAFLGLFGLSSYLARQRIKEIGIRKVLGGSSLSIVRLITKDFIIMVFIGAIPASLLAWYTINNWLSNFAFQTDMNFWYFLIAIIFTVILTLITTGFHAFSATKVNPVQSLKE